MDANVFMSVGDTNQDGVIDEEEYFLEFKREIPGWRWNAAETKVVHWLFSLFFPSQRGGITLRFFSQFSYSKVSSGV